MARELVEADGGYMGEAPPAANGGSFAGGGMGYTPNAPTTTTEVAPIGGTRPILVQEDAPDPSPGGRGIVGNVPGTSAAGGSADTTPAGKPADTPVPFTGDLVAGEPILTADAKKKLSRFVPAVLISVGVSLALFLIVGIFKRKAD